MEITLTNEQYFDLVKMVFLGNLMINSTRDEEERLKNYDLLEQYLYQYASQTGFDKNLTYVADRGRYLLNREFLETSDLKKMADDFVEDIFWGELTNRLASRDTIRKYGQEKLTSSGLEEFLKKQEPFLEKYNQEFEKNGLENLNIR
jgi:hypothetical protein